MIRRLEATEKGHSSCFLNDEYDEYDENLTDLNQAAYEMTLDHISAKARTIVQFENASCLSTIQTYLHIPSYSKVDMFPTAILFTGNQSPSVWVPLLHRTLRHRVPFVPILSSSNSKTPRALLEQMRYQLTNVMEMKEFQMDWITKELHKESRIGASRNTRTRMDCNHPFFQNANQKAKYNRISSKEMFCQMEKDVLKLSMSSENNAYDMMETSYIEDMLTAFRYIHGPLEKLKKIEHFETLRHHYGNYIDFEFMFTKIILKCKIVMETTELEKVKRVDENDALENLQNIQSMTRRLQEWKMALEELEKKDDQEFPRTKRLLPIIIRDYESIDIRVFSDFIDFVANLAFDSSQQLQLCLVLSITSRNSPVYRCMPDAVSRYIDIQTFTLTNSKKCVSSVFHSLIVDRVLPIVLSTDLVSWIMTVHLPNSEYSIGALIHILQLVCRQHFLKVPYSFLSVSVIETSYLGDKFIDKYSEPKVACIPPLKLLVDDLLAAHEKIISRRFNTSDNIQQVLTMHASRHLGFMVALECLQVCTPPSVPFLTTWELCSHVWNGTILASTPYALLKKDIISICLKNQLESILKEWTQILGRAKIPPFDQSQGHLQTGRTETLTCLFDGISEKIQELTFLFFEGASDKDFEHMLLPLRDNMIEVLDEILSIVQAISTCPLSDVFSFTDTTDSVLQVGSKHSEVRLMELQHPSDFLSSNSLRRKFKQIYKTKRNEDWSDTALAFRLFDDPAKGTVLCVKDWYNEFEEQVVEEREDSKENVHLLTRTRFVTCCAMLQRFGILGASETKGQTHIRRRLYSTVERKKMKI